MTFASCIPILESSYYFQMALSINLKLRYLLQRYEIVNGIIEVEGGSGTEKEEGSDKDAEGNVHIL